MSGKKPCPNVEATRRTVDALIVPCDRKGKCCECIRYHLKRKELPGCVFPPEIEKTYDRSIRKFVSIYRN